MYQAKTIRTLSKVQSHPTPPMPSLYHWLGADAERVAQEAMTETSTTPPYHWLGADAEKVAARIAA